MKCKSSKTSKFIGIIMLIIGVLVGVCAKFLSHNTIFHVEYLYGISCGLVTASILAILISYIRNKNPKYRKQDMIKEQDERNQLITLHSNTIAYSFLFYGITLLFILDLFIPLPFHYTALCLILMTACVQTGAYYYYDKKY